MTVHWSTTTNFYHIYPLGLCGAPPCNDFRAAPVPRLGKIFDWLDHIEALGCNALYLGPLFESTAHGYDTADYFWVDRRLGDNDLLAALAARLHRRGFRLVLDGVFNHVGRDFWAFRDLLERGPASPYSDWFAGLCFGPRSPYGDPFTYQGWNNHYDLVKLNLANPAVRDHLFLAIAQWVERYEIDGLRLDTADCLDLDFLRQLSRFCRSLRDDFWLVGEAVHGDYRRWANPDMLASVTNYECYKGLYSSHNDHNYFEIAYAMERQFGPRGLYRDIPLYNFADNHDVSRLASMLADPGHLYPLYCLLFTMPGVPAVYYGSEWGIGGRKEAGSDAALRPCLELGELQRSGPHPELAKIIARLAFLRRSLPALCYGSYRPLLVAHQQLAFLRQAGDQRIVVAVNAAGQPATLHLALPEAGGRLRDVLDPGDPLTIQNHRLVLTLDPCWGRVLQFTGSS